MPTRPRTRQINDLMSLPSHRKPLHITRTRVQQQITRRSSKQGSSQRKHIRRGRRRHITRSQRSQHLWRSEGRRKRRHGSARRIKRDGWIIRDLNGGREIREQGIEWECAAGIFVCVDRTQEDIMRFDIPMHHPGNLMQPVQPRDKLAR